MQINHKRLLRLLALIMASLMMLCACNTAGPEPVPPVEEKETGMAENYVRTVIEEGGNLFSATVGNDSMDKLTFKREVSEAEQGDDTLITLKNTHEASGLVIVTTITLFGKSDALEIANTIENTSDKNSPTVSNLFAADVVLPIPGREGITLKTARGLLATGVDDDYDFSEVSYPMGVGGSYSFAPSGGRSCNSAWPYFDLIGSQGGAVLALGWTGQWKATFDTVPGGVHVRTGQEYFSAFFLPGEKITTPTLTVCFYEGSSEEGRNDFRQLYLQSYTPQNVKEIDYKFPVCTNIAYTTSQALETIKLCKERGLKDMGIWQDAGWYGESKTDWSGQVGNWYPNKDLGEDGMVKIADTIHAEGYRYILWYEPERAQPNSKAAKENRKLFYDYVGPSGLLLRLDTEEGYQWLYDLISYGAKTYKFDIYRQDFNINPLDYWLENDPATRLGMTENKYINNMYRFLDALLAEFPHLVIDNCASGGRRLDIAMMKRCVSLFRTDYSCLDTCDPEGIQSHQQNILSWLPLSMAGLWCDQNDTYNLLSSTSVGLIVDYFNGHGIQLTQQMQKYYRGDYYNLLKATYDRTSHQAWQLFRSDLGEGFAIVIARPETPEGDLTVKLKGLDPSLNYTVTLQGTETVIAKGTGRALMEVGVTVHLPSRTAKMLFIQADAPADAAN